MSQRVTKSKYKSFFIFRLAFVGVSFMFSLVNSDTHKTKSMNNNMLNQTKAEKICALLRSLGHCPFRFESSYPVNNAQRNLAGKSHYVDQDTLRVFKARILSTRFTDNGLVFALIESVGSKPTEPKKNKRFVCFDVFGTVVNERDQWFATSAQAEKAMWAFLNQFDAEKHTAETLAKLAKRKFDERSLIESTLETL